LVPFGKDGNGKPVDVRIAFNLTAGSLTWRCAVRPAGTTGDYVLRHDFTFTRASANRPSATGNTCASRAECLAAALLGPSEASPPPLTSPSCRTIEV
jgi:hypothetical protein